MTDPHPSIEAGTELTCTNEECECNLIVQGPCTIGTGEYRCACGARLVAAAAVPAKSGVVISREVPTARPIDPPLPAPG